MQMYELTTRAHKPQAYLGVTIEKALMLLDKHAIKNGNGLITFKECRRVWGWLYHLSKEETDRFINELRDLRLVHIVAFHGIIIIRNKEGESK